MQGRIRKTKSRPAPSRWATTGPSDPPPSGGGDGGTEGGGGDSQGGESSKEEKQLPQSRVNEIVAAESKKAAEKAASDLASSLGVSVDEAKTIIADHQKRVEGEKSEAQKAREAADKEKAEAEKSKAEAAREVFSTRAERALVAAGADPDNESLLQRLTRMLDVQPGASYDDIKADVKKVKEDVPAMFGGASGGGGGKNPPTPGSDPKGGGRGKSAVTGGIQRGLDRAKGEADGRTVARPKPPGMP